MATTKIPQTNFNKLVIKNITHQEIYLILASQALEFNKSWLKLLIMITLFIKKTELSIKWAILSYFQMVKK
jgi:hypothetical protein